VTKKAIMEQVVFYILAAVVLIATFFSITEKHAVHAIIYLATSFFALAVIFYLLNAPLVAVFEVIIYAGAIMVLFLFVIMMLDLGHPEKMLLPGVRDWGPALLLGLITLAAFITLALRQPPPALPGSPLKVRDFAAVLFGKYGIAVEIVSMQLLFALVGALYLGRRK
jgi:NADH-quinone oxidoreductase subunit J